MRTRMPLAALGLAVLLHGTVAAPKRKPSDDKDSKRKKASTTPPEKLDEGDFALRTFSVTVAPAKAINNCDLDDDAVYANARALADAIEEELHNYADADVVAAVIGPEVGLKARNLHLQICITLNSTNANAYDDSAAVNAAMDRAKKKSNVTVRVVTKVKLVKAADRLYLYGYCRKDQGLRHYERIGFRVIGMSDEELEEADRAYRSKGSRDPRSSDKMNTHDVGETDKRVVIEPSNQFICLGWFIKEHGLQLLKAAATQVAVIKWMMEARPPPPLHTRRPPARRGKR